MSLDVLLEGLWRGVTYWRSGSNYMIVKKLPVLSVTSIGFGIYAVARREQKNINIVVLDNQLNLRKELTTLPGSRAFILWSDGNRLLISVDNRLALFEDRDSRVVLEARPSNFFWHSVVVGDKVFFKNTVSRLRVFMFLRILLAGLRL